MNGDDSGLTFSVATRLMGEEIIIACVTAYSEMIAVGSLRWLVYEDGDIGYIHVDPEMRRQGIGTLLLRAAEGAAAQEGWPPPKHSDTRTPLGEQWATSMGAAPAANIYLDELGVVPAAPAGDA